MTNKEKCTIVQDLLPNYVEKLTSDSTNIFIEEHLKECKECTDILNNMKKNFEKENNNIEKEIDYAKKYNMKFRKMKFTLLIVIYTIIFIIIAFFTRNFIVFRGIANKMENYLQSNNYYIREYCYEGWNYTEKETWAKNQNIILNNNGKPHTIIKDGIEYTIIDNNKYTAKNINEIIKTPTFEFLERLEQELKSPISIFWYSFDGTAIVNGKECYRLKYKDEISYFEKTTGLLVRYEKLIVHTTEKDEIQSEVSDFTFKFDSVTDKDLEFDLSNLKQI